MAGELAQHAREASARVRSDAALTDTERSIASGRLTNLVTQLRLRDPGLDEELRDTLDWLLYRLFEDDPVDLIGQLGRFEEVTQARFLRPKVEKELESNAARRAERVGRRLSHDVLVWLYPQPLVAPVVTDVAELAGRRLDAEFAAQLAASDPESGRYAAYRPLAVWASLAEQPPAFGSVPDLDVYFAGPPWSPQDLCTLDRWFPGSIPVALMAVSLKAAPSDPSYETPLVDLCDGLLQRSSWQSGPADAPAVDLVRLRRRIETCRRPLQLRRREAWFQAGTAELSTQLGEMLRGAAYATSVVLGVVSAGGRAGDPRAGGGRRRSWAGTTRSSAGPGHCSPGRFRLSPPPR